MPSYRQYIYIKTVAPTVNDDGLDGYLVDDRWLDTTHNRVYQALDVSAGAAVWKDYTPSEGWIAGAGTWSYSSADSPTFIASIPDADAAQMVLGDRFKLTQTTVKYFIVTAIGSPSGGFTPVTVYGGTDYILANAAITLPYWSHAKAPLGFPVDPTKWTVTASSTDSPTKSSPTASTWYGGSGLTPTGLSIDIPIGSWKVRYVAVFDVSINLAAVGNVGGRVTLSTANNSESDVDFTAAFTNTLPISATALQRATYTMQKDLTLASKTTYYLNGYTGTASAGSIIFNPAAAFKNIIKAVCNYL